jgi:hypothetical protein
MAAQTLWLLIGGAILVLVPTLLLLIRLAIGIQQALQRKRDPLLCTACGTADVRPSWRSGVADRLLVSWGFLPYRCRACGFRFYRLRRDCGTLESAQSDAQGIPST